MTIARILRKKGELTSFVSPEDSILKVINDLGHNDVGALVVSSDRQHIEGINWN